MRIFKRFHFHHTKAVALRESTIVMSFLLHKTFFLRSKMHCHERNDATSVISVTTSNSLRHKMRIFKHFHFHHTKALALRESAIVMNFRLHKNFFLRSKMHAMRETMLPV